jgi:hypothetical protein
MTLFFEHNPSNALLGHCVQVVARLAFDTVRRVPLALQTVLVAPVFRFGLLEMPVWVAGITETYLRHFDISLFK